MKGKKMDMKFDDIDKDMAEMKGESSKKTVLSSKDPIKEVLGFLTEEKEDNLDESSELDPESYEAVCERLRSYSDQRWICLPVANSCGFKCKFLVKDIYSVTNKEFHAWVNYLVPSANHQDHKPEAYTPMDARERTHDYVIRLHNSIQFPSIDQIMPVLKLGKKK